MKIEIYGKPNCPWCDKAKAFLDAAGFPYEYHDNIEDFIEFLRKEGIKTVPAVFLNEIYIGGYNELIEKSKQQ